MNILLSNTLLVFLISLILSLFFISADLIIMDEKIKKQILSEKKALASVFRSFLIVFLTSFVILSFLILLINKYLF